MAAKKRWIWDVDFSLDSPLGIVFTRDVVALSRARFDHDDAVRKHCASVKAHRRYRHRLVVTDARCRGSVLV